MADEDDNKMAKRNDGRPRRTGTATDQELYRQLSAMQQEQDAKDRALRQQRRAGQIKPVDSQSRAEYPDDESMEDYDPAADDGQALSGPSNSDRLAVPEVGITAYDTGPEDEAQGQVLPLNRHVELVAQNSVRDILRANAPNVQALVSDAARAATEEQFGQMSEEFAAQLNRGAADLTAGMTALTNKAAGHVVGVARDNAAGVTAVGQQAIGVINTVGTEQLDALTAGAELVSEGLNSQTSQISDAIAQATRSAIDAVFEARRSVERDLAKKWEAADERLRAMLEQAAELAREAREQREKAAKAKAEQAAEAKEAAREQSEQAEASKASEERAAAGQRAAGELLTEAERQRDELPTQDQLFDDGISEPGEDFLQALDDLDVDAPGGLTNRSGQDPSLDMTDPVDPDGDQAYEEQEEDMAGSENEALRRELQRSQTALQNSLKLNEKLSARLDAVEAQLRQTQLRDDYDSDSDFTPSRRGGSRAKGRASETPENASSARYATVSASRSFGKSPAPAEAFESGTDWRRPARSFGAPGRGSLEPGSGRNAARGAGQSGSRDAEARSGRGSAALQEWTRQGWTILVNSEGQPMQKGDPDWEIAKSCEGVKFLKERNFGDETKPARLGVPGGENVLPAIAYCSKSVQREYITGNRTEVTKDFTPLNIYEGDHELWDEAKKFSEVSEYPGKNGTARLGIRTGEDTTALVKAGLYWGRDEWTTLAEKDKAPAAVWKELTGTPGVVKYDEGKKLGLAPGKDLLGLEAHWPSEVHAEYEARDSEVWKPSKSVILNTSKLTQDKLNEVADLPYVKELRGVGGARKFFVPAGKNAVPASDYWDKGTREEYRKFLAQQREHSARRPERERLVQNERARAKAMGR